MRVNCSAVYAVLMGDRPHLSHELEASSDTQERRQVVLLVGLRRHCVCCCEGIGVCSLSLR